MRPTLLGLISLLACRPDPGDPAYPDPNAVDTGDTGPDDGFYEGPDPYVAGEARLAFGAFYEGQSSEVLPVDDVTRHYYIYEATYTTAPDLIDRVEGYQSDVITHAGGAWWGGGINWDASEDLSTWTTLHVSLRSDSATFAAIELRVAGGGEETTVAAADHGWAADGQWHHLSVPLSAFSAQGTDLSSVTAPFILVGGKGAAGDELRVDNLYWTAE